jgi:hypothetical protein
MHERDTSHGEPYPGPSHGDDRPEDAPGQQQQRPQPPDSEGDEHAKGNAPADARPGASETRAGEPPPAGGSPGSGVSANVVDPGRPGPVPEGSFADLGQADAHVAVETPTFADSPPAGYDPRTAPADTTRAGAVPEENLPGHGAGDAARAVSPRAPRSAEESTRDAAEIRNQAPGDQPEGGKVSS